jgi:hypothetical protein
MSKPEVIALNEYSAVIRAVQLVPGHRHSKGLVGIAWRCFSPLSVRI